MSHAQTVRRAFFDWLSGDESAWVLGYVPEDEIASWITWPGGGPLDALAARYRAAPSEETAVALADAAFQAVGVTPPQFEFSPAGGGLKAMLQFVAWDVPHLGGVPYHKAALDIQRATGDDLIVWGTFPRSKGKRLAAGVTEAMATAPLPTRGRIGAAAIEKLLGHFLDWVDTQEDAVDLRAALPQVQGDLEGWMGDALLWHLFQQNAKTYKVKRPLEVGTDIALNAFLLLDDFSNSGALEVGPSGDLIRVPSVGDVGSTADLIVLGRKEIPQELHGVPAHRVSDLLHESVDLSALSPRTRMYLRAYLRAFVEDDEDVDSHEAQIASLGLAIEALPFTAGGLAGLEDIYEQFKSIAGAEWVDHPIVAAITLKRRQIEDALKGARVVDPEDVVAEHKGRVPVWAQDAIAAARGEFVRERLAKHGQGGLVFAGSEVTRDSRLLLSWAGGGRRLTLAMKLEPQGIRTTGSFQSEMGVRDDEPKWWVKPNRIAQTMLPDVWLDRLRTIAPVQIARIRYRDLEAPLAQDSVVRKLVDHARSAGMPTPVARVDEHGRIFLTTLVDDVPSTVVVPKDGRPFPWGEYGALPGQLVDLSADQVRRAPVEALSTDNVDPDVPDGADHEHSEACGCEHAFTPGEHDGYEVVEALAISDTHKLRKMPKAKPPQDSDDVHTYAGGWSRKGRVKTWNQEGSKVYGALLDFGYRLDRMLGCGSFGCAYLGRPYVVKVTGDATEAANAQMLLDLGNPIDGVVKIYAVFAFSDAPKLYAVVMEVLEPASREVQRWIDGNEGHYRMDWWKRETVRGAMSLKEFRERRAEALANPPSGVNVRTYFDAIDALYDLGIYYQDGHGGNVMVRPSERKGGKGTLVAIDLGYSGSPGAKIPVLL